MAKNRKNIIIRIQDWIESVPGQTFLNYAYSWGAAVVILGALFKLTHIPGANAMSVSYTHLTLPTYGDGGSGVFHLRFRPSGRTEAR